MTNLTKSAVKVLYNINRVKIVRLTHLANCQRNLKRHTYFFYFVDGYSMFPWWSECNFSFNLCCNFFSVFHPIFSSSLALQESKFIYKSPLIIYHHGLLLSSFILRSFIWFSSPVLPYYGDLRIPIEGLLFLPANNWLYFRYFQNNSSPKM